jgi:hypothetical protein
VWSISLDTEKVVPATSIDTSHAFAPRGPSAAALLSAQPGGPAAGREWPRPPRAR